MPYDLSLAPVGYNRVRPSGTARVRGIERVNVEKERNGMVRHKTVGLSLAIAIALATVTLMALEGKSAPEETTGIKVGAKAPRFELVDQSGKRRSLEKLLEQGPVALVFYRSADW